ncbi:MAG: aromatic ring-hydroxylating dioxygenase subunit alpha [Alphaproteobacteria bacterium]
MRSARGNLVSGDRTLDGADKYPVFTAMLGRLIARIERNARTDADAREFFLPTSIYCDPARLEQERARIFRRRPLILAHASELGDKPGSTLVIDRIEVPLLLVRDRAGAVHGLLNVCRHRGTRLIAAAGPCHRVSFACPYHAWVYDLAGKLKHVPMQDEMFPSLKDLTAYDLARVPVAVRHGFIWAILDPAAEAIDLAAHLAGIGADLDAFGLPSHVVFKRTTALRRTNWKSVMDAFLESYHVTRLHRGTVGGFFLDGFVEFERAGDHMRAAVARTEIAEAKNLAPTAWDERRHATFSYTLFPNSVLVFHPDYVSHIGLFPTRDPDATLTVHTMLTPRPPASPKEDEHWQRSFALIDGGVFQGEDFFISEQAQIGLRSGANAEFRFGLWEHGVRLFHESVDRALGTASVRFI